MQAMIETTEVATELAVALQAVRKSYGKGNSAVQALDGVDVGFARRTFTAVMGPSGSGKSTLLHCAAGLDRPTSGHVWIGETELGKLSETELTKLRRTRVGFVFQSFNLVPALNVRENVLLPSRLAHRSVDRRWLNEVLTRVGLDGRLRHRPAQLSGGQQQRVAIARALVNRPALVLGDEPTGAVDSQTSDELVALLRRLNREEGVTFVVVTHDLELAAQTDRIVRLADGRVLSDDRVPLAASA